MCPKKTYFTRKEAKKDMKEKNLHGMDLTNAYYCGECSGYHLTSMDKKKSRKMNKKFKRKK